jgi:membrane protein YdbS with pleckstrin-like domain
MVTLREKYPLEKRKPLKKTIAGMGGFIFLILFVVIFGFSALSPILKNNGGEKAILIWCGFIGICVLFLVLKYIYEVFYMKYYFYDMDAKNLMIKKGVFAVNEITLPINRLQDVYVDQDILDRIFGLYDVHVSSATIISGNLSHIDGLNKENSDIIKNLILSGIHKEND